MRVLIAPDKFAGTLSAREAADAIAAGWHRTAPDDDVRCVPLSDGGPGFVDVLAASVDGHLVPVRCSGPLRSVETGQVLVCGDTAYVESAQAAGLHLVAPTARDPGRATTYGAGELLTAAVATGAGRIVVGVGGTATTDAGAGLLAALGGVAYDSGGCDVSLALSSGGGGLEVVAALDLSEPRRRLAGIELVVATDIDAPLLGSRGAARGYGPQKGADDATVEALEAALAGFASAVGRIEGKSPAVALGSAAGGGLAFALLALGAVRVDGASVVFEATGVAEAITSTDLLITGEGRFDWQSLHGKLPAAAAELALANGVACVVLAGEVLVGKREYGASGVSAAYAIVDDLVGRNLPPGHALSQPAVTLADLAERVARTWSL